MESGTELDRSPDLWMIRPSSMKKRSLGKTGAKISEVGLGCWQLGGADWGDISEDLALEILQAAVDAGVTFFDSADVYGSGRSEELIGKFLKIRSGSEGLFVATKLGRGGDLYPDEYTEAGIRAATEASLQRLGVEALDLTQLHCVPEEVLRQGDVFEWLRALRKEGKIRHFGASVETIAEAHLCLAQEGLTSLQIIFNIFRQRPIEELFPAVREAGVGLIVRLPLASGLLSGKFTRETTFGPNDHRTYNRDGQAFNVGETFAGLPFEKGVELAEEMKVFVPSAMSMVQMAQRWILDYPEVSVVIPGARTAEQAKENASASNLPRLPIPLHERLANYHRSQVLPFVRGAY